MSTMHEGLVQYSSGGLNMHAVLATPEGGGKSPGVLVIHEWWGLNDHIRDIAKRLARAGYVALAPDLYSRLGHVVTTDADEAARLMQSLKASDALKDLQASLTYLNQLKEVNAARLGALGFCMGGSYVLQLACTTMLLKAAVPFYGQVPPDDQLRLLRCPILYFYGGRDTWITRAEVERLRRAVQANPAGGEVRIYEQCGHAFFNDTRRDAYHADAAKDAWQRTLAFLKAHL